MYGRFETLVKVPMATLLACTLVACGGGGSGGSTAPAPMGPAPQPTRLETLLDVFGAIDEGSAAAVHPDLAEFVDLLVTNQRDSDFVVSNDLLNDTAAGIRFAAGKAVQDLYGPDNTLPAAVEDDLENRLVNALESDATVLELYQQVLLDIAYYPRLRTATSFSEMEDMVEFDSARNILLARGDSYMSAQELLLDESQNLIYLTLSALDVIESVDGQGITRGSEILAQLYDVFVDTGLDDRLKIWADATRKAHFQRTLLEDLGSIPEQLSDGAQNRVNPNTGLSDNGFVNWSMRPAVSALHGGNHVPLQNLLDRFLQLRNSDGTDFVGFANEYSLETFNREGNRPEAVANVFVGFGILHWTAVTDDDRYVGLAIDIANAFELYYLDDQTGLFVASLEDFNGSFPSLPLFRLAVIQEIILFLDGLQDLLISRDQQPDVQDQLGALLVATQNALPLLWEDDRLHSLGLTSQGVYEIFHFTSGEPLLEGISYALQLLIDAPLPDGGNPIDLLLGEGRFEGVGVNDLFLLQSQGTMGFSAFQVGVPFNTVDTPNLEATNFMITALGKLGRYEERNLYLLEMSERTTPDVNGNLLLPTSVDVNTDPYSNQWPIQGQAWVAADFVLNTKGIQFFSFPLPEEP